MCVIMVELDVIVNKWGCPEFWVILDHEERDWVLKDCGIQVVGPYEGESGELDGDDSGDGSHVQEALKHHQNNRGLIYPGK